MARVVALLCCLLQADVGLVLGQEQGKVFGPAHVTEPWEAFSFTEPVAGSDIPVEVTLLETVDGLFTPIGIRHPTGKGPFPIVMFFTGNGGAGVHQVRDYVNNYAYTLNRFLDAGYAVAWLNYRAEVWFEYTRVPPLQVSHHQANQLMNRPPLEYNDLMTIVEYVKRLPYIDSDRVGLAGNSHGGGMILKAAAEGMEVAAAVVSEPDASELLQMEPAAFAGTDPQYPTMESVARYFNKSVAMERIRRIKIPILLMNRDHDPLQGIFETAYTWMKEANLDVQYLSYDHPVHGYLIRVPKDEKGVYHPDAMQLQAIQRAMDFFTKYMPSRTH